MKKLCILLKTFDIVKSICVKADGAPGHALLHFNIYISVTVNV